MINLDQLLNDALRASLQGLEEERIAALARRRRNLIITAAIGLPIVGVVHVLAGGGKGAGALAAKDKAARDALRARAERAKREEFRLLARSVEELHQLLEFLEVEGVDKSIDDKPTLVKLIIGEKKLSKMTKLHQGALISWHVRASSSQADVRKMAISITEREVSSDI